MDRVEQIARELDDARQQTGEPMLRWFTFSHLPLPLQPVSSRFAELAVYITSGRQSAERTVALRKLLEAKDAAVRNELPA